MCANKGFRKASDPLSLSNSMTWLRPFQGCGGQATKCTGEDLPLAKLVFTRCRGVGMHAWKGLISSGPHSCCWQKAWCTRRIIWFWCVHTWDITFLAQNVHYQFLFFSFLVLGWCPLTIMCPRSLMSYSGSETPVLPRQPAQYWSPPGSDFW